jgi:hypothetical protein
VLSGDVPNPLNVFCVSVHAFVNVCCCGAAWNGFLKGFTGLIAVELKHHH